VDAYVHHTVTGEWAAFDPALLRDVIFAEHNLATDGSFNEFDLIVCRNVLIYFDRPMQERLFQLFTDCLLPGGYLVLGKVESLVGPVRDRLQLVDARERVFRRAA